MCRSGKQDGDALRGRSDNAGNTGRTIGEQSGDIRSLGAGPRTASAEQVTPAEALASSSEAPQVVIETVKTPAAPKAGPAPSVAKAPVHDAETVARHEPESPHAAVQSADAPAANSMICDSKSVRGRFTGIGHSTGEAAHPSPPKETPRKPAAQKVPMSRMDADTPRSHAGHDVNAAGQTARAPKPLSGVVNAVAQQIGHAPVADPFALEQTVDSSAVDPINIGEAHSPPTTDIPRPSIRMM